MHMQDGITILLYMNLKLYGLYVCLGRKRLHWFKWNAGTTWSSSKYNSYIIARSQLSLLEMHLMLHREKRASKATQDCEEKRE